MIHISHMSLCNFRNYGELELDLPPHPAVFQGGNAQGKTNLLEAMYLLATTRPYRAITERELINWSAMAEELPVARLVARVQRGDGEVRVEVAIRGPQPGTEGAGHAHKQIRINGVPRRAADAVGQVRAVMFSSQDIELISGAPAGRRRYLDLTSSQLDPRYVRALQRYHKVVVQRNHLLRQIAERRARADQLEFWDHEMLEAGSYIVGVRQDMLAELDRLVAPIHQELSGGTEQLSIAYVPSALPDDFARRLATSREREVAQGRSLVGPHRDDLVLSIDQRAVGVFGSRGQQRTAALSLKLAEARLMRARGGDSPVLLLDDVLSELDAARRRQLLQFIASYEQVVLTATDIDRFPPEFLDRATLFEVRGGRVDTLSR